MGTKAWYVIPECYIDTNLVEFLLHSNGVNHQKGCNAVATTMERKLKEDFAIGVIDDDKRKHSYYNNFVEIARSEHIRLMKHAQKPHYFIVIKPAMDQFILDCAKKASINPEDFNLPTNLEDFKQVTKHINVKDDNRIRNLFQAMGESQEISILKNLLNYLNEKQYLAKSEEMKTFFEADN